MGRDLFVPTLVGTVYGMNVDPCPNCIGPWATPFAVTLMVMVSLSLNGVFKRRGWILTANTPEI